MTETQVLLTKIAALRQRLEQAQGLVQDAKSAATALMENGEGALALERRVTAGAWQQLLLETTLRQIVGASSTTNDNAGLPAQLTSRGARLLRRAHELLGQLRTIADDALLSTAEVDPLAGLYRETVSMTDTVLRTIQAFPEAPSAQIRLCEGLEAVLGVVGDRLTIIVGAVHQRLRESKRRQTLAELLSALAGDHSVDSKALLAVAETIQEDAAQGQPLQFPQIGPVDLAQHIAGHSIAVAQVIARACRHETEWRNQPLQPILAALVHDVGMLKVPAGILTQKGPLKDEERRQVEAHALFGPDLAGHIAPSAAFLVEAAGQHHEYLDGTGYPSGLRELQIKPLIRLLSICDAYTAMCQPRPHRAALDTRTALTDTLLMAEKGLLDRQLAERLLLLSFYPIGSVIEMSDGAVGLVVATHQARRDLNTPARPVVALLTDSQGQLLPTPRVIDLAETEGRSIVRGLPVSERCERLGSRYPQWAA
jgi:HD-GYP domain-containing protein (c-di-GMP phosphodiesterase class II)